jgi:hypothetical protein
MEKFGLQHTVLYAKGWYRRYNNHPKAKRKTIWDDLEALIEMDGYMGFFEGDTLEQKKSRIVHLLLMNFERLPYRGHMNSLTAFYEGIKERNCWQYGYTTNKNCWRDPESYPEYDREEAVVRYILSFFMSLDKDDWEPCMPDYSKLPRKKGIKDKTLKTHFGDLTEETC